MKTFWETENRYKYNAACWGFGPLGEEQTNVEESI